MRGYIQRAFTQLENIGDTDSLANTYYYNCGLAKQ